MGSFIRLLLVLLLPLGCWAQLEKMPADLETDYALSALPAHLRAGATVYLLDPAKGYYVGRPGSNGFICFVSRTDWEWGEFRQDLYTAIAFGAEGARTTFQVYKDVAGMRASGKFTAQQVKDSVADRIRRHVYVAPSTAGISFMLEPIMRVYVHNPPDNMVMTMSMPHYMFYAPYVSGSDVGTDDNAPRGPWLLNPGSAVLGDRKGPFGYIVIPAGDAATAKMMEEGKALVTRLQGYRDCFKMGGGM